MKVLVVGGGAREHALCLALHRDPSVTAITCAPGNPGIATIAICRPLDLTDPAAIAGLAVAESADLVLIGPEGPLVAGAADTCRAAGVRVFGPSAAAAQIEGSKAFAKSVMAAAGVRTAMSRDFTDANDAVAFLAVMDAPYVVKYDGLAGGKGVTVTSSLSEAAEAVHSYLAGPGDRLVIEEHLTGQEVSLFAVVTEDGQIIPLTPAQDHKRVGDGDTGPNTGGMGAYSPLDWAPADLVATVTRDILEPVVAEMAARGAAFSGLLYAGLMLTPDGVSVIEFNARFGDPETQVVLARLLTPLTAVLLGSASPSWSADAALTVVVAAAGYPTAPRSGDLITGIAAAAAVPGVDVLHAGTALDASGEVVTAGGRVLSVTAVGATLADARESVYNAVDKIHFAGAHHRTDIALTGGTG